MTIKNKKQKLREQIIRYKRLRQIAEVLELQKSEADIKYVNGNIEQVKIKLVYKGLNGLIAVVNWQGYEDYTVKFPENNILEGSREFLG